MEHQSWKSRTLKIFQICIAVAIIIWPPLSRADFVFALSEIIIHPMETPDANRSPRSAIKQPIIRPTEPLRMKVQIRTPRSFQYPSVYLAAELQPNDAYLIPLPLLARPESLHSLPPQHKIEPANVYVPIDILAIDAQGTITQIWPDITLSEIRAPLLLPPTSHAVLYLAPNRTAQLGVTLKDRVEHKVFSAQPETLR